MIDYNKFSQNVEDIIKDYYSTISLKNSLTDEFENYDRQIKTLNAQKRKLHKQLESYKKKNPSVSAENREISDINSEISSLNTQLKSLMDNKTKINKYLFTIDQKLYTGINSISFRFNSLIEYMQSSIVEEKSSLEKQYINLKSSDSQEISTTSPEIYDSLEIRLDQLIDLKRVISGINLPTNFSEHSFKTVTNAVLGALNPKMKLSEEQKPEQIKPPEEEQDSNQIKPPEEEQGSDQFNPPEEEEQGSDQFNPPEEEEQDPDQFNPPEEEEQDPDQFNPPKEEEQDPDQFNPPEEEQDPDQIKPPEKKQNPEQNIIQPEKKPTSKVTSPKNTRKNTRKKKKLFRRIYKWTVATIIGALALFGISKINHTEALNPGTSIELSNDDENSDNDFTTKKTYERDETPTKSLEEVSIDSFMPDSKKLGTNASEYYKECSDFYSYRAKVNLNNIKIAQEKNIKYKKLAENAIKNSNFELALKYLDIANSAKKSIKESYQLAQQNQGMAELYNKMSSEHDKKEDFKDSIKIDISQTPSPSNLNYDIGTELTVSAGTPRWEDSEMTKGATSIKSDTEVKICAFSAIDENGNYIPETRHMSYNEIKEKYPNNKIMVLLGDCNSKNPEDPNFWKCWVSYDDIFHPNTLLTNDNSVQSLD